MCRPQGMLTGTPEAPSPACAPRRLDGAVAPPCACRTAARGQSPRSAPAPPGRALAFVVRCETVFAAPFCRSGGNAVHFLSPPGEGAQGGAVRCCQPNAAMAKAMAPAIEAVKLLSSVRAGSGNALRFPRPCGTLPRRPAGPGTTQASARPGGREAPAGGGSCAGRGLWPPAGPDTSVALWQGRWPLPWQRLACFPQSGREQETHRVSPAPAGRCPADRRVRERQRPAPDPAGEKRPPGAGRALVSMIFAGPVV